MKSRCKDRRKGNPGERDGGFKGRVLKVKMGYNPNSSSIGSHIHLFLTLAAGVGTLAVLALHLFDVIGSLIRSDRPADGPYEKDAEGQGS